MKIRVKSIGFADPITSYEGIEAAEFTEQPSTLRDDAITLKEGDPEESEEYSHEDDAPSDYSIVGGSKELLGSFLNMSKTQIVGLLGGTIEGTSPNEAAVISSTKTLLNKAVKITGHNGEVLIIPNAKGYCLFDADFSKDGVLKAPFKFKCLQAAADWKTDLVWM